MELIGATTTIDDLDAALAELEAIGDDHGCTVQAFDARYVAGPRHLQRAVELADRAIDRGEAVARDRAVEILLYAAGRRQIDRALEMGVGEGTGPAVLLVDAVDREGDVGNGGESADAADREAAAAAAIRDLEWVEPGDPPGERADPDRLESFFEIAAAERAATDADLTELVCERVALLAVEK